MGGARGATTRARERSSRRRIAVIALIVLTVIVAVSVTYLGYVGWEGSEQLVHHEKSTNCTTPAAMGWLYEAINYDIADDAAVAAANPDGRRCASQGQPAGTALVSSDGIRLAGWFIPAARGGGPGGVTIVLAHGLGANKSDMLRHAAVLHDRFDLLLFDQRDSGRSSGDAYTIGALEQRDVQAVVDWLAATKHPGAIGLLGVSAGAAAGITLARTDHRIAALVLDSVHARFEYPLEDRFPKAERLTQLGVPALPFVWAVYAGMWLRTGTTPADADPLAALADIRPRPLMIVYGTADSDDLPARNAQILAAAATRIGIPVEVRACEGAGHADVIDVCAAQYGAWVVPFFERALATAAP